MVRERTGKRDLSYSHWHRGHWDGGPAKSSTYQDIDGLEYCKGCGAPLLLVETAIDNGRDRLKGHRPMLALAKLADVPAVLVFYELGLGKWCEYDGESFITIAKVTVRYVHPERTAEHVMTPEEWAREIDQLHEDHQCASRDQLRLAL